MSGIDVNLWKRAIKAELKSIYSNKVQDLIKDPKIIKPIGWKWVYKRKRGVDRKVKTYKVSLIAKCYSQKPSFDYEETFLSIIMHKSVRVLCRPSILFSWHIQHRIVFLHPLFPYCALIVFFFYLFLRNWWSTVTISITIFGLSFKDILEGLGGS